MNNWTNKILAHLHDPPEKPYDFGKWHKNRAEHYAARLGLSAALWLDKTPDWTAAGADRLIFPDPSKAPGLGQKLAFRHPMTGEALNVPFEKDQGTASHLLDNSFPEYSGELSEAERFFLLWRCWSPAAASQANAAALPFLPADTRIPDGSIWNHNSVVSAIEGTRGEDGKLKPALLLFQIGPVQDFISQARSTRDLWSGSYLLSWLIAHGLKKVSDELGPDSVIFPSLRGQSLFDWLHRDLLKKATFRQGDAESRSFWKVLNIENRVGDPLTPNLPNRFLALVPADFNPAIIEGAIRGEWERIAEESLSFINLQVPLAGEVEKTWDFQVSNFLKIDWQVHPWADNETTMSSVAQTGSQVASILGNLAAAAEAIPDKDSRCYPLNAGVLWSGHFDLASQSLDGRRACRNFDAWTTTCNSREKDAFSGKEEALIDSEWLAKAARNKTLKHLFRKSDKLGAINLIKRVWHVAWLEQKQGFKRQNMSFGSVYAVAAGKWKATVADTLANNQDCWLDFLSFAEAAHFASDDQSVMDQIAGAPSQVKSANEVDWLAKLDAELLTAAGWIPANASGDTEIPSTVRDAQNALHKFLKKAGMREPTAYYAVIALDGDKVGEWLSGANNPKVRSLLSEKAVAYFEAMPKEEGKRWLDTPRPLSPSFHLGFSEALSNFGLYAASRVVTAHHGQLIYSGGDDVLAMVPAEEAIACAEGLRLAFQGAVDLADRYPDHFEAVPSAGLIHLKTRENDGLPNWPLLVPGGKMTVSAGIAIGHAKAPLQDMIEEAREAEKRAKRAPSSGGLGRNALAVSLLKRSGEIIHWGAPFGSASIELLRQFQQLHRDEVLPGTFGHRVPELVERFDPDGTARVTREIADLIEAEVQWSWNRLEGGSRSKRQAAKEGFFSALKTCLSDLETRNAPVTEFTRLFAVETFLKRHIA